MKLWLLTVSFVFFGVSAFGMHPTQMVKQVQNDPSYYIQTIPNEQFLEDKEAMEGLFDLAWQERNESTKVLPGWKPAELKSFFFAIVQGHYLQGYIDLNALNNFKNNYNSMESGWNSYDSNGQVDPSYSHIAVDVRLKNKYKSVYESYLNMLQNNAIGCANEGEFVGNKKCCSGHIKVGESQPPSGSTCSLNGSCSSNSDCCSGFCSENMETGTKSCMPYMKCSRIRALDEECDLTNQFCISGNCRLNDLSSILSSGECKGVNSVCSDDTDCCSGTCQSGQCKEIMKCMDCKVNGARLEAGDECCPGYIKFNNKCYPPVPKYVPTVKVDSIKKSIFSLIVNNIFPVAYAAIEDDERLSQGQQELLQEQRERCNQIPSESGKEQCLAQVGRQQSRYENDNYLELTHEQSANLIHQREVCTTNHATGTQGHTDCMATIDALEKDYIKNNLETGADCANNNEKGSEAYKECMVNAGLMSKKRGKEDYIDEYNIPGVTAKTYSDPKACEFNSYNDSWRDASNKEKNAELFLRAFEYVFSHKGTTDYWFDKNADNKSIFPRAKAVAEKFRKNRQIMLKGMQEIDRKMACQCIAIFGPAKFDSVKQNFFKDSCEEEQAMLKQALGGDLNDLNNKLDNSDSKIDGETSISSLNGNVTKKEKDNAVTEEIDKGAIGISHEKLLVEWLNLRAEAQLERFNTNSELEEELQNLSKFVSEIDFVDVYKDSIQNDSLMRYSSDPKYYGDTPVEGPGKEYLYRYGFKYTPGWLMIALVAISFAVGGFLAGPAILGALGVTSVSGWMMAGITILGGGIGAALGNNLFSPPSGRPMDSGPLAVSHAMIAAWQYHENDEISASPELQDIKRYKKCIKKVLGVCVKKMKGWDRLFLGARYDNYSPNSESRCQTYGRAATCFKSGYISKRDGEEELSYILDATQPLFVADGKVSLNKMPGYNLTFPQLLNEARDSGVNFLKAKGTNSGFISGSLPSDRKNYRKKSDSYGQEPHLDEAKAAGHFFPKLGKMQVESVDKNQNGDKSIEVHVIDGAAKYARCKSLVDCGAKANELDDEEALGFGFLFETDSEARQFADYVYQIHWRWSHLTKNSYMGYPLIGLEQYFALVAYNMKLVGSLSASRAVKYSQAYEKYKSDFESRVGEYNSLGQLGIGTQSSNIKYSSAFYEAFGQLNFSGETNLEQFDAAVNKATSSGKLSQAEVSTLSNGRQSAVRRNSDIAEKKAFDKAVASADPLAKKLLKKNSEFSNSIVSPLNTMKFKKLGGGSNKSAKDLAAALNNINNKIDGLKGYGGKKNNSSGVNFTLPKSFNFSRGSQSGNSSSTDSNDGTSESYSSVYKDMNMKASEVDDMLNKLNDSDSLGRVEDDTLFTIVSKAYKRNYSKVLRRQIKPKNAFPGAGIDKIKEENLSDKAKNELKSLLE